jgi:hypothetical protein
MLMRKLCVIPLLLLSAGLALSACAGRAWQGFGPDAAAPAAAPPVAAVFGADAWPAPSGLPKGASSPPSDGDRYREGTNYSSAVAAHNFSNGTFEPLWNPPGQAQLSDAAYADYKFLNMTGYAGIARIKLAWNAPPQDSGDLWIALANFALDRWDWFNLPGGEAFSVPSFAPYTSAGGELHAVVLLLGQDTANLRWILAGENLTPKFSVMSNLPGDPLARLAPISVNFDAGSAESVGGTIVGFDFDWEGDGVWDITADTDGQASHTFAAGAYSTKVRATDDHGVSATQPVDFIAIDPSNQPPIAGFGMPTTQGLAPLSEDLNPTLSTDPDGTIIKYEWDFDTNGVYDMSTTTPDVITHRFGSFGLTHITLRVTDNNLATDTIMHTVTCNTGWRWYFIRSGVRIEEPISVAVVGSGAEARPCVVYQDYDTTDLVFQRALDSIGTIWGAATSPVPGSAEKGFSPSICSSADGSALIAYGVHEPASTNYDLYTVHAVNVEGTAWNPPVAVSPSDNVGSDQSLIMLNSLPVIAAVSNAGAFGTSQVLYYQSLDSNGGSWGAAHTAVPAAANQCYSGVCLGPAGSTLFKRPLVSYIRDTGMSTHEVCTSKGSNIDGTAWDAPVVVGAANAFDTFNMFVDGNPAVLAGNPNMNGGLQYSRADNANGSAYSSGLAQIGTGGYCSMIIFNGKPAACYYDYAGSDLWFVTASDAQGSSWDPPYQVHLAGATGLYCQVVLSGAYPMIVYYDQTNKRLMSAYFELS